MDEMNGVFHPDCTRDERYTVELEHCGYPEPRWVSRFCGTWITQDVTEDAAWTSARRHNRKRRSDMGL